MTPHLLKALSQGVLVGAVLHWVLLIIESHSGVPDFARWTHAVPYLLYVLFVWAIGALAIGLPTILLFRRLRWNAMLLWVATAAILPLLAMMVLLNNDLAWSPAQLIFYPQFLPGAACGWIVWYRSRQRAD